MNRKSDYMAFHDSVDQNLTVIQRLCTNESTRLVINSHMYEPDCPSSQKYEQERCTALAFEPNPLTVDGELNCR